ncbi:MAG TPA: hypothetical protein P5279_09915 [Anaerohalosphaeraceae bacterium]|jgi:hypothetical protein|nr:hypothetical protein [Anaerohalosphaeraceae bacterium]
MEEPFADPAAMTPHKRRQEIAAILARGVLRLRQADETCPGSRSSRTPENPAKQRQNGLDVGRRTSPHVPLDSHE